MNKYIGYMYVKINLLQMYGIAKKFIRNLFNYKSMQVLSQRT